VAEANFEEQVLIIKVELSRDLADEVVDQRLDVLIQIVSAEGSHSVEDYVE